MLFPTHANESENTGSSDLSEKGIISIYNLLEKK